MNNADNPDVNSTDPVSMPTSEEEEFNRNFDERPSSFSPPCGIDLSGFASEEIARTVGNAIAGLLHVFGKVLNLELLHRVIVAYDYDGTLRNLDRGMITQEVLTPTRDELAEGIAMTPAILVDGKARSVMVLNAYHMIVLAHPDREDCTEYRARMIHTLAHECGHVHDLAMQVRAFPDLFLHKRLSYREGVLHRFAAGCWDEYIASRLSAFMGERWTIGDLEDTFCAILEEAKPQADSAIRQYRMHGDLVRVAKEATEPYRRLLIYGAYLVGHIDGVKEVAFEELAPKAAESLRSTPHFVPFFNKLVSALREMHETYGRWDNFSVYDRLHSLADELLIFGGVEIEDRPNGEAFIKVPSRPETMPSLAEQIAFRMSQ